MHQLARQIDWTAEFVHDRWSRQPRAAVILGSGLGTLADQIECDVSLGYEEIPHFAKTTAIGHEGRLVCGELEGVPLVAFQGRFHLYEGHPATQAALPVRLARALGAEVLIVSNAAGGVNPRYRVGDLMLIEDHINLMFDNPLIGVNDETLGPRFPDMSEPYDAPLMQVALEVARRENFSLHRGVYMALLGPTYETRSEYRLARTLGADVVGMSTVPEVLAAVHAGMRVLGVSTVTNVGSPDAPTGTSGHDVIGAALAVSQNLTKIVRAALRSL